MATRGLGTLTIDFIAKTAGFEQGMSRAARVMRDNSRDIRNQNKELADAMAKQWESTAFKINAALGIIGAAVSFDKVVSTITGFQDSMLKLQATSRATSEDMAQLEKQARSLGATSRYSAQQAADAQNFLAMAGFNTASILAATGDVIQFASAASIDLARSADIASNVIGQMRMPVSQLTKAMDVMISTTQQSNTDVNQLAEALSYAGPIAASAGVSISELSAAIGVLGDSGVQASRAGTGVVGIIAQLSNLTPKATDVLSSYGLTAEDVSIKTHGLSVVMERLRDMSIEDSLIVFGREAAAAAEIIAASTDRVNELTKANEEAAGRTREVATLLDKGLRAAFASISSAVEEMMLQLGDSGLAAALQMVAVTAAGVINEFNGLLPQFVEASGISSGFAGNIKLLADSVKVLATVALSALAGRLVVTAGAFAASTIEAIKYQAALARMAGVSATAATAITALGAAARAASSVMAIFGGPLGLVATIAIASTAFIGFSKQANDAAFNLDDLGKSADEATERFKELGSAAQLAALSTLGQRIRDQENEIRASAAAIADALTDEFGKASYKIGLQASDLGSSAADVLNAVKRAAMGMAVDWNTLAETIKLNNEITDEAKNRTIDLIYQLSGLSEQVERDSAAYNNFNDQLNLNNQLTSEQAAIKSQAEAAQRAAAKASGDYVAELEKEIQKMEDSIKTTRQLAEEYILLHSLEGGNAKAIRAAVERHEQAAKAVEAHRTAQSNLNRSASGGQKAVKDMDNAIKSLVGQLFPAQKLSDDLAKNTKTLDEALKRGTITAAQHADGIRKLNDQYKKAFAASLENVKGIDDKTKATLDAIEAMRKEINEHGKSASSLARLALADTNAREALLKRTLASAKQRGESDLSIKAIEAEIEALGKLKQAQQMAATLADEQERIQQYDEFAEEANRMNEEIGRTLTDALMRAFESGKGFADAMKSVVMNMFKTMVLQPIIQPIVTGVSGAFGVAGQAAMQGAAGGLGGMFGGGFSPLTGFAGSMSGMVQNIGGSLAGLGGSLGDFGANIVMNADVIGSSLDKLGAGFSYASSIFSMTQGKWGAGIGGAAGQFFGGPIGSFIGSTLGGMLDKAFGGETRGGGYYQMVDGQAVRKGGASGGDGGQQTLDALTAMFSASQSTIDSVFRGLGVDASVAFMHGMFEDSGKGRGGVFSGGHLMVGGEITDFGTNKKGAGYGGKSGSLEEMFANLQKDLAFSTLEAWQSVSDQMPTIIGDMLTGVDVRALSAEQAQAAVEQIQTIVMQVNALSDALNGMPLLNLHDLSFDLTAALLEASGGIEALTGNLSTFYENFYSEAERSAIGAEQLIASFNELGVAMPTSAQGFRDLVNSIEIVDDASAELYTSLIGLSGATSAFFDAVAAQSQQMVADSESYYAEQISIADQAYKQQIANISDHYKSSANALKESLAAEQARINQAYSDRVKYIKESYDRQRAAISESVASVTDKIKDLEAVSKAIESSIGSLVALSDESARLIREQSRSVIDDALKAARAGKSLVGFDGLTDAIKSVGTLTADAYSTYQDFERERLSSAHDLAELAGFTSDQLDVQDMQLNALNSQLEALEAWRDRQLALAEASRDLSLERATKNHDAQMAKLDAWRESQELAAQKRHEALVESYNEAMEAEKALLLAQHEEALAVWLEQNQTLLAQMGMDSSNTSAMINSIGSSTGDIVRAIRSIDVRPIVNVTGYPAFANGGGHSGGGRVVGEFGAEFEVTGSARYFNAQQTQELVRQSIRRGDADMKQLSEDINSGMHSVGSKIDDLVQVVENWNRNGMPETREIF